MAQPQNEKQTNALEPIYPRIKRAIIVGASNFNDVWKDKRGNGRYV